MTLHRIGLQFEDGKISIFDMKQWKRISMIERAKIRMPSTTNSLEASHGHINGATPRRNEFLSSLSRLTHSLTKSDFQFSEKHLHSR